jgi:phosphatidylglycerophosphate synthase
MTPPTALAAKGQVVEEWIDLHFFRPFGFRIARALQGTGATPDQITVASLLLGLAAGHLMVYRSIGLNAAGVGLFIVSDIFDSADGQLARMRGTSTRFGRILDGASDNLRFINLYVHLLVRLLLAGAGWGWEGLVLALAAGLSHSFQSAAVDFMRQAYLYLGAGRGSELDLPETAERTEARTRLQRIGAFLYRDYVRRQAWLFPRTVELVRAAGAEAAEPFRADYRDRTTLLVGRCAWIGQNMRFLLLAVTAVPGWPAGFFWLTVGPLNLILLGLVLGQERAARALLRVVAAPAHPRVPARARIA